MIEEYEKVIGFADAGGTRAEVSVLDDDEGPPTIHVSVGIGMSGGRGMPTIEATRQFAAALLDAADIVEKAQKS